MIHYYVIPSAWSTCLPDFWETGIRKQAIHFIGCKFNLTKIL